MATYFTRQASYVEHPAVGRQCGPPPRSTHLCFSGDTTLAHALLRAETDNSRMAFARVSDARGQVVASTGNTLHAAMPGDYHLQAAEIRLPAAGFHDAPLNAAGAPSAAGLLGWVEVGVASDAISVQRDTLILPRY
jgi:hypothetical protein